MKVAIIPGAFFPDPGGAQVQAHNLANIFNKKKIKTDLILLNKTNLEKKNYKIFYLNKFLINIVYIFKYYINIDISFLLKAYFKKIIIKNNYKVWHFIFLNYKSLLIINVLKKLDQKIIVTFQGADIQIKKDIQYGNRLDKKYDILLKRTINNIDKFTSISKNIRDDLLKLKIKEKRIMMIPNGIYLNKFLNNKKKSKKNDKSIKLITVARYAIKKKGYDLVPQLTKLFNKNKIDFKWTIIGKDTSKLYNEKIVFENKKNFKILENIYSNQELYFPNIKIINEYKNSDFYINLSRIESFGITFIEAIASNIPIITFDSKGANEIVKNNLNGIIIKDMKIETMFKKIVHFKKNQKNFRKKVFISAKSYDLEEHYKLYHHLYSTI